MTRAIGLARLVLEEADLPQLLVYALAALALPWVWGAVVAAAYSRRERRKRDEDRRKLRPGDYTI